VYTYNSSYTGGIGKRTKVQSSPRQKLETLHEKLPKAKKKKKKEKCWRHGSNDTALA
jgi:hypothetical protein